MPIFTNSLYPTAGEQGTGGGIIQVKYMCKKSPSSYNGGSFDAIGGLDVSITPQKNTNKILVMSSWSMSSSDGGSLPYPRLRLTRRIASGSFTEMDKGDAGGSRTRCMMGTSPANGSGSECQPFAFNYIDTPNTTSECTYRWEAKCYSSRWILINGNGDSSDANVAIAGIATMIAMEFSS